MEGKKRKAAPVTPNSHDIRRYFSPSTGATAQTARSGDDSEPAAKRRLFAEETEPAASGAPSATKSNDAAPNATRSVADCVMSTPNRQQVSALTGAVVTPPSQLHDESGSSSPAATPQQRAVIMVDKFQANATRQQQYFQRLLHWDERRSMPSYEESELQQNPAIAARLNVQQQQIAHSPPHIPLAVIAGAGTGKTHTMMSRAYYLAAHSGIDPSQILMVTFTKKAANEMKERLRTVFGRTHDLPTAKTFHAVAYRWVSFWWRESGLGRTPRLLVERRHQVDLMKDVIRSHVREQQRARCSEIIGATPDIATWEKIVQHVTEIMPIAYHQALATVGGNKKEKKGNERAFFVKLSRQCYLEVLRHSDGNEITPLHDVWEKNYMLHGSAKEFTKCAKEYLSLVEKSRLGQHDPTEYLPTEGDIIHLYEKTQKETGNLDFDKLLLLFVQLLGTNPEIRELFHQTYSYIIVDEFQDNSRVQSELLRQLVKDVDNSRGVTVVGDDDQCIYEFRGAHPGNFEDFQEHYKDYCAEAKVLEENYRSTNNILKVAQAFLSKCHQRQSKTLVPRPDAQEGDKINCWSCIDEMSQARFLAAQMRTRHDEHGTEWGEMACLLRCFRKEFKTTHLAIQSALASFQIPFKVVGGTSFLESEVLRDVLAYMQLAVTGFGEYGADAAFERIVNKPSRGIGKSLQDKFKDVRTTLKIGSGGKLVGLEEAAFSLRDDVTLSRAHKKALDDYFSIVDGLRASAVSEPLPDFINTIWHRTGLDKLHAPNLHRAQENMSSLLSLAESHLQACVEHQKREREASGGMKSMADIATESLLMAVNGSNRNTLPQVCLPRYLLEGMALESGVGPGVVLSFLENLELQHTCEPENGQDNRVTISTIHRAKGLEWDDVYIPFFNMEYMPCSYQNGDDRLHRHRSSCIRRRQRHCKCSCNADYIREEEAKRGIRPQAARDDSERRLAHVAATRARRRLSFLYTTQHPRSSFYDDLLSIENVDTVCHFGQSTDF